MSRASSPAAHWSNLDAWLSAMTTGCLPKDTGDPKSLTRQELDADVDQLMSNDPTQTYSSKEWSRIIGSLAHNLVAQARLAEEDNANLEKEIAGLKTQLKEARKQKDNAQEHLDQLLLEVEAKDETHPELQKEVERLQKALEDLRTDTDKRMQSEKRTTEELQDRLRRGDALLKRAESELKDREARAKACEKHLQAARTEINELVQQRHDLKYELEVTHRELKHAYKLQGDLEGETPITQFPLTSEPALFSQEPRAEKGGESPPLKTSLASHHEPPPAEEGRGRAIGHNTAHKELDKLARNIPTFTPNPAGGHDVHSYLQDIDFHLQTVANVTTWDKLYLLRITSSRDVRSFLDCQSETVKRDYPQLRQALIREFSDPESDQGIIAAMDLRQARLESPQAYYGRLRQAYFGSRNESGMEEDWNFKTLFLRNLHPTLSHHLGVLAEPRTMSIQQLRDLAHKAYTKQKTVSEKTVKNPTICPVSEHRSELSLEGTQHPSYKPVNRESRSFQPSRGQRGRGGARPRQQNDRSGEFWDRPRTSHNQRGGGTWETGRQPRRNRPPSPRTPSPDRRLGDPSRHDTGKLKLEPKSNRNNTATSEAAELLSILREFLQKKPRKEDKDKPDTA